jgi:cytochrome c-type biogenesis protein CcmH/NrfG
METVSLATWQRQAAWLEVYCKQHPCEAWGWERLGFILRRCGRPQAAVRAYRKAIDLDATAYTWVMLGLAHHEAGHLHAAHMAFITAAAMDQDEQDWLIRLGYLEAILTGKEAA